MVYPKGDKHMKTKRICKYCNNSVLINGVHGCLGGKKENIERYEQDARELEKHIKYPALYPWGER